MKYFRRIVHVFFILIPIVSFPLQQLNAQNYQPAIVMTSFLNMRFYDQSGGFMVGKLQIVFPPADFNAAEFVISDAAGKQLASVPLRIEQWDQFKVFNGLVPNGHPGIIKLERTGDFVMSVKLDEKEITKMPFTLDVKESGDPFNPKKQYSRSGLWKNLAFISAETEKPENALKFNYWTSTTEAGSGSKTSKITVSILKGGQEIAESRSPGIASNANWQFISSDLRQPKSAGGKNFTLDMFTQQDGEYIVVLKTDEREIRRFNGTVSGGKLQRIAECDLGYQPHTSFISPRLIDTSSGSGSRYKMLDAYWLRGN